MNQVVRALIATGGNRTEAAARLKCARQTVQEYIARYPEIERLLEEINEVELDYSEGKLRKLIRKSDKAAIFFHLKCKGKDRGWVERREHTGKGGGPIQTQDLTGLSDNELLQLRALVAKTTPAVAALPAR